MSEKERGGEWKRERERRERERACVCVIEHAAG